MKIDCYFPDGLPLGEAAATARAVEEAGFPGMWVTETKHNPFLTCGAALAAAGRIEAGPGIAVAFPRSPMVTAQAAWDLAGLSGGRFVLGLGTQIQPHIEKRFSMPWSHPARRMREFISALRAIWSAWEDGTKLRFEGEFYTHKIMTPMFTPEPQPYAAPKVFLAAVGEAMTEMCGEVADGHLGHSMVSKRYLDEVTLPALMRGVRRSGRDRNDFQVSCGVMVATGENDAELTAAMTATRKQIAFYGSTPAYQKVLELHGWGDLHPELNRLSKLGEWDVMASLIDDDMLGTFAVVGPLDEVGAVLRSRCEGVVDRALPIFYGASQSCITAALKEFRE